MADKIKFEDALNNLENIVRLLEGGSLSLDESIAKYEEAIEYVKICNSKLEAAEQKVRILTKDSDGMVSDHPFNQNYKDED